MELIAVISLLVASLALNAFLFFKLKNQKQNKQESYEVVELLHDLTAGRALIEVRRVAPASVFMRSPRGIS